MDKEYIGKSAVITGASTGIGYELAKHFAQNGFDILITSKNSQRIAQAGKTLKAFGAQVDSFAADLATCEGIDKLYAKIKSMGRPIDAVAIAVNLSCFV